MNIFGYLDYFCAILYINYSYQSYLILERDEILCHTCKFYEGSEQMKKDDPASFHLLQKSS